MLAAAACGGQTIGSVGAILGRDNDTRAVYIRDAPEGMGAERAGLLPGDEILMIDGVYVRDLTSSEVRARLRGEVGTAVDLTVVRGGEVFEVRVVRGELRAPEEVKPREERLDP
ncbi:MAG: PDZ domain-containing protein [Polyangiaceae bacterium]|nr:PDZ domain-containing protein [Polyangiaceae bacterium]